jgi:hypothetical protein
MAQSDFDVSLTEIYVLLAWILMIHIGVICPTGSHLTTCFSLRFELQRGHRITFLNVMDVQDIVLAAANFEFRAIDEIHPIIFQAL